MSLLSLEFTKLISDSLGSKRQSSNGRKVHNKLETLEKIELAIGQNIANQESNKAKSQLAAHEKEVRQINTLLDKIITMEFSSLEKDCNQPLKDLEGFSASLNAYRQLLINPNLQRILRWVVQRVGTSFNKITEKLNQDLKAIVQIDQLRANAVQKNNLAELISSSEAKKREIDQHLKSLLKDLKQAIENIKKYRGTEQEEVRATLDGEKILFSRWIKEGNQEFRQAKNGRWMMKKAGVQGIPGTFVKKEVLAASGIPQVIEQTVLDSGLIQLLEALETDFEEYIKYIQSRIDFSYLIITSAVYIEQKMNRSREKITHDMRTGFSSNSAMLKKVAALEIREKKIIAKEEATVIQFARHSAAATYFSSAQAKRWLAACLAASIGFGAVMGQANSDPSGMPRETKGSAVYHNESLGKCIASEMTKVTQTFKFKDVKNFDFDVADKFVNSAPSSHEVFPELLNAVKNASKKAGYGSNYHKFIQETQPQIRITSIKGYTDVVGNMWYNLNILAPGRAAFTEEQLADFTVMAGIPVTVQDIQAVGETGSKELLEMLKLALSPANIDRTIANIRTNLPHSSKGLNNKLSSLIKQYHREKSGTKKEKILNRISYAVHKIAALDVTLLAKNRKVEIEGEITFHTVDEKPTPFFVVDDAFTYIMPAPKALLPGQVFIHGAGSTEMATNLPLRGSKVGKSQAYARVQRKNRPRGQSHGRGSARRAPWTNK